MKKLVAVLILLAAGIPAAAQAVSRPATPAERAVAQARQAIAKNPEKPEGYNALALGLARRARETSDANFYLEGEEAVRTSLQLAPDNYGALQARAWLLLGRHEFAAARQLAAALNKRMPDDLLVYGFLADANAELGNYAEAEKACNWMLKLRPGNIPALTRAAYLRELFGDLEGALELMDMAYQATPPTEVEDRAWILTQMSHLKVLSGSASAAEPLANQALALFPNYHYALAVLAKVRTGQERHEEAADLLRERYRAAPHPENLYDLAVALQRAGQAEAAAQAFAQFEKEALAESGTADNSNRELIFYYADRAKDPARALEVARREFARRRDVHTLDAYAWALHVNGRDAEARPHIEAALAVGVREPGIYGHAREIARGAGDGKAAEQAR